MNKKELERISLEVAKGIQVPLMPEGVTYFVTADLAIEICTRFLSRIDAERGKSAVGYDAIFKAIASATKAPGAPAGIEVSVKAFKEAIGGEIFHSPSIPESMCLVPIVATPTILSAYCHGLGATSNWDYMIAAAQGERNAD